MSTGIIQRRLQHLRVSCDPADLPPESACACERCVDAVQPREWKDLLPSVPEAELVQTHCTSSVDLAVLVELVVGKDDLA